MNQIALSKLMMLQTTNVSYSESVKTNYANYQPYSTTQNGEAMIDLLNGTVLLIEDEIEQSNI